MIRTRMLWIAALLALAMIAGCGGKKAANAPTTEPAPAQTTPQVEETPTDQGSTTPSEEVAPMSVNDAFFDFDSYALTSEAKGTLEANAREMKRVTTGSVTIEGHCDERGTKAYNLALGEKRANAAKDYLVALGVSAARINTVSYGKERPFDDGHNEAAWAKNRRAHFVISQ
ncbi:MAG TPA: peptidoglycan-associated lipoprotein Pal [Candidatus Krumholzibacteria bacterium]|nr:peptidoglycan-associated lipoprotein Pal [Candidatus Krumholzibacteria bacterium]